MSTNQLKTIEQPLNYDSLESEVQTTESSLANFLRQENDCVELDHRSNLNGKCNIDDDEISQIFLELNRLSGCENTQRSIEDILNEASTLIKEQDNKLFPAADPEVDDEILEKLPLPFNVDDLPSDCNNVKQIDKIRLNADAELSSGTEIIISVPIHSKQPLIVNENRTECPLPPKSPPKRCQIKNPQITTLQNEWKVFNKVGRTGTEIKSVDKPSDSTLLLRNVCDQSTSTINLSVNHLDSFNNDHVLRSKIEVLEEKLKDTEERFQSLHVQHNSLSFSHRNLRDTNATLNSQYERLQIEYQNLEECSKILRTELQSARNDKIEAIEVNRRLQSEIDDCRKERKLLEVRVDSDVKTMQDLTRQVREMDRIIMRKHPDSVSALIVASKSTYSCLNEETIDSRKLLEQRIIQLENDAKQQDQKAQGILANVQSRFSFVQSKYETHIADLETQVLSLQQINTQLHCEVEKLKPQLLSSIGTQTISVIENVVERNLRNNSTQTDKIIPVKLSSESNRYNKTVEPAGNNQTILNKNLQSDSHLMATIRGMKVDLAIKEKTIQRLTKEIDELKKSKKKILASKEALRSENGILLPKKIYDATAYAEQSCSNVILKETANKLNLLEQDYKLLQNKRLQDLKTLQSTHEQELAVCQETIKVLQHRLAETCDSKSVSKRSKVPSDYFALKAKVTMLEQRHSEREKRLHMLIDVLSKEHLNETSLISNKTRRLENINFSQ